MKDTYQTSTGSFPTGLTAFGDVLFFGAEDGTNGNEPWMSDGTADGTILIKDIWPGPNWGYPEGGE